MMWLTAFALLLSGSAALALAMTKHHRDIFGRIPSKQKQTGLRVTGWLLTISALGQTVITVGISLGVVIWLGMATLAIAAVSTVMSASRGRAS